MQLEPLISLVAIGRALPIIAALIFAILWGLASRRARGARQALTVVDGKRRLLIEALEATPCNFAVFSPDGTLVAWNSSYEALHRHSFATLPRPLRYRDLMRTVVRMTVPPDEVDAEIERRVRRHFDVAEVSMERLYPDGRWMSVSKRRLPGGEVAGFALDITDLRKREAGIAESEARYRALVDSASVGIWHLKKSGETIFANARLSALFGGTAPAQVRTSGLDLRPAANPEAPFGFLPGRETETTAISQAGDRLHLLVAASPWLTDDAGEASCVLTLLDVTPLKTAQQRVEYMARHDPLTGLGNRTHFIETLATAMDAPEGCALLAIDLDHFKPANDRHGHLVGDALLRLVAERMKRVLPGGLLCRLGGDEFAAILPGRALAEAERLAWHVAASLAERYEVDGICVDLSASVGVAHAGHGTMQPDGLANAADIALYEVKRSGRGGVAMFSGDIAEQFREKKQLQHELEGALEREEFSLVFQPQVSTASQSVSCVEALLRWNRPGCGRPIPPDEFLAVAAEMGMLGAIDDMVLDAALRELAIWEHRPDAPRVVAINISASTLADRAFPKRVEAALRLHGVAAHRLEIEVPETMLDSDLQVIAETLRALDALGISLALDDFGAGRSSFAHIVELPVHRIKLDRRVIAGFCHDPRMRRVVDAVLAFARHTGLDVVAEGVELEAQFDALRFAGCTTVQGYLTGRPMSATALNQYLRGLCQT